MEAEKVFSTVEIILMVILALVNDLGLLLAWILAAFFGISIAGIEVVNVFIFAIILWWFIMRTKSFGTIGTIQVIGGIVEFLLFPSRTITTALGIYIANNPKSSIATAIGVASMIETGGASKLAGGAAKGLSASIQKTGKEYAASAKKATGWVPQKLQKRMAMSQELAGDNATPEKVRARGKNLSQKDIVPPKTKHTGEGEDIAAAMYNKPMESGDAPQSPAPEPAEPWRIDTASHDEEYLAHGNKIDLSNAA